MSKKLKIMQSPATLLHPLSDCVNVINHTNARWSEYIRQNPTLFRYITENLQLIPNLVKTGVIFDNCLKKNEFVAIAGSVRCVLSTY